MYIHIYFTTTTAITTSTTTTSIAITTTTTGKNPHGSLFWTKRTSRIHLNF